MVMYAKTSGSTGVSPGRAVQLLQNSSEASAASNALAAIIRESRIQRELCYRSRLLSILALLSAANYHGSRSRVRNQEKDGSSTLFQPMGQSAQTVTRVGSRSLRSNPADDENCIGHFDSRR